MTTGTPKSENPLVKAALDHGAKIESTETKQFNQTKGIKDALGDGKIDFHPELPKVKFADLVGVKFVMKQARIIDDWDGIFGTSTFALILIENPDGSMSTSIAGGKAILRQIRKLLKNKMLPVKVTLNKIPTGSGEYYLFE